MTPSDAPGPDPSVSVMVPERDTVVAFADTVKLTLAGSTGPELGPTIVIGAAVVAVHDAHRPGGMPGTGMMSAVYEPPAFGTLSGFCPPTLNVTTQKFAGCGF